ncbi:MAG: sugar ABC transporter ATP-binding protein [Methanocella sp.]
MEKAADRLLEMRQITKDFPGVRALDRVSFDLVPGEIHALVGANGAGKSTLIKVLGGVFGDYGGEVLLEGQVRRVSTPRQADDLGISIIHQEFSLVPKLTVAENIMLGKEPRRRVGFASFLSWRDLYDQAERLLAELKFDLPLRAKVDALGVAEQQLVQIAKAMAVKTKVLVMDEPTARLSRTERDELFVIMRRLSRGGTGIIYISHFLEEVFMIADRVTVLRDGRTIQTRLTRDLNREELVRLMLGREIVTGHHRQDEAVRGAVALQLEHLDHPAKFRGVNLSVSHGEILGIAGLVGSGRTELARAVFGADRQPLSGRVVLEGKEYVPSSPKRAIARGLALLPEDRKQQGLVLRRPVEDNIALAVTRKLKRGPFLDLEGRAGLVQRMVERLKIKCSTTKVQVGTLSGGNQQKVVLAKWLAAQPKVLILDQPTAGIDVGTKEEIYAFLEQLARGGAALIVISDDPGELARVCDRVLIMRKGRIVRELADHPSSEEVLSGVTADY